MKVFGVDTTRKKARIFIFDEKNLDYNLALDENVKHSEGLFLYIQKALNDIGMDTNDIDNFACVVGPGSFTGIRVGMSTIKGLNKVCKKNVISVNTFEIIKSKYKNALIVLASTMTSCYYARVLKGEIVETGVLEKTEIAKKAEENLVVILKEEQNQFDIEYNNIEYIEDISAIYKSVILDKINNGALEDFVPYYLQLSQAERNLKNE